MTIDHSAPSIAYFSMEAALAPAMPTYSGGLGVLAGDILRAAADIGLPMVGLTLLHRQGYFRQHLDGNGQQTDSAAEWLPEDFLEPLPNRVTVEVEGRPVVLGVWRFVATGASGATVPVYLLDADLPENANEDRALTGHLYGGDGRYRLAQEVLLGIGGVAMLRDLGFPTFETHHMNEGHSALLALALLEEVVGDRGLERAGPQDYAAVRKLCVFTTHTPVPAGHDAFPIDLAWRVVGPERSAALEATGACVADGHLDMTRVALFFSRYVNGVSMRHGEVSQAMYPDQAIHAITNGVHAETWVSPGMAALFDSFMPGWREDNNYLHNAGRIPLDSLMSAHSEARRNLIDEVFRRTNTRLSHNVLTIGFARRAATYKRAAMVFSDRDALRALIRASGPVQFVFAGKAHPHDAAGQALIREIFSARKEFGGDAGIVYLEDYDMGLAKLICAGVDLWLNNPEKPQEASGTSGMKAALNGIPSLSVLDGWWVEGWIEGVTGWSIGDEAPTGGDPDREAASLYHKLRYVILPMFYNRPEAYAQVMRSAIGLNGSFFNAERMMRQYAANAYRLPTA